VTGVMVLHNAQYTPPTPMRRDATKQFRRVGVGGVYWALSERT